MSGPPSKNALLQAFDESGITAVFMDPDQGGFIEGPKNLALALTAFELAWVDAGAATGSLAGCLALSPIHERGTPEQRDYYMSRCAPAQPGEDRKPWRGAFCLTEPIPYVGVETGMLGGKVARSAEWDRKAKSPCSRSISAAASSPTWGSPTSSPPPWNPTTRASRAPAW